jgi:hypothetical protein
MEAAFLGEPTWSGLLRTGPYGEILDA